MKNMATEELQDAELTLDGHGLAAVTLSLDWNDGHATHHDEQHIERFSVWREGDLLPAALGHALPGSQEGACYATDVEVGELAPAWSESRLLKAPLLAFDRHHLRGLTIDPRVGRFYPQGFFSGMAGAFSGAVLPARVVDLDEHAMQIDFNHPMAPYAVNVGIRVEQVLPGYDRRGGRCIDPLHQLMRHPGMAAPLRDGRPTDYGDHGEGMACMDGRDDDVFYSQPRMLQHLDRKALDLVSELYARLIPRDARVLDLMGSFDSHLQAAQPGYLEVLGMNADELRANKAATQVCRQNLNHQARLPQADGAFDAVICTASIEYLKRPRDVISQVRRILRPDGLFIVTFSNRWFPTKAIRIWSELHEFERLGMVTQWLDMAGFEDLHTLSSRGWPRPEDDPHAAETAAADPVYAVWGRR